MDGNVEERLVLIRDRMPKVYAAIKAQAEKIGNTAYAHVRAGLRGEPNRFYAMEGGFVVGTPFNTDVAPELAQLMVRWGATYLCIWPAVEEAAA